MMEQTTSKYIFYFLLGAISISFGVANYIVYESQEGTDFEWDSDQYTLLPDYVDLKESDWKKSDWKVYSADIANNFAVLYLPFSDSVLALPDGPFAKQLKELKAAKMVTGEGSSSNNDSDFFIIEAQKQINRVEIDVPYRYTIRTLGQGEYVPISLQKWILVNQVDESVSSDTNEKEPELSPLDILKKSTDKLNGINTSFTCDLRFQSLSEDQPKDFNFNFYSYWPNSDSKVYYNYIKFDSPIDWKGIEIWGHYNKKLLAKKRMPINNEITVINNESENINIVDFFNFVELAEDLKDGKFSIKNKEFKNKDIFLIKAQSSDSKGKKKAIKFYIDQDDYSIYKIEWTNKKGKTYKTILFEKWVVIENINMASKIIYEDIKNGTKVTCKLSDIQINNINQEVIDLINIGFKVENQENE